MMPELNFFVAFVELFNINASLMILILCAHVILRTNKLDRGFLKARLFLNSNVLQQMWISMSIAGAAFAINSLLKLVGVHLIIKEIIYSYYLVEFSQMIFFVSFIYAIIIWYQFINTTNQKKLSITD